MGVLPSTQIRMKAILDALERNPEEQVNNVIDRSDLQFMKKMLAEMRRMG